MTGVRFVVLTLCLSLSPAEAIAETREDADRLRAEAASLTGEIVGLWFRGEFRDAMHLAERACNLYRRALGDQHTEYAASLSALSSIYVAMGEYGKAEPICREAIAIYRRAAGERHVEYASSLTDLADLYLAWGKYAKAERLFRQAAAVRKRTLGCGHRDYAASLNSLAELYLAIGVYAKAEHLCQQAMAVRKEALGVYHVDYAASLNSLAKLYVAVSEYAKAEPLYEQAIEIYKDALGDDNVNYAASLTNLGRFYRDTGEYAKAEPLYQQAMEVQKKALGGQHRDYATSLNSLAELYTAVGDYAKAEALLGQAMAIRKRAFGCHHPEYAESLNSLGELYRAMGEYAKAVTLYQQAIWIQELALGDHHPQYARSLSRLASLYMAAGDYRDAEPLLYKAREVYRKTLGDHHPCYVVSLNDLATLYITMGEYAKAEPFLRQVVARRNRALGDWHPDCARNLINLALLYVAMEEYGKAKRSYYQSMEIQKKALVEQHPDYATSLTGLASVYTAIGDYSRAEPLLRQAMEIRRKALVDWDSGYAESLNGLGLLYYSTGEYAKGEPLFHQAIQTYKMALGQLHPYYAECLSNLARLLVAERQPEAALRSMRDAWESRREQMAATLESGTENEQMAFDAALRREIGASLTLAIEHVPGNAEAQALGLSMVLSKGAAIDSMTRRRAMATGSMAPDLGYLIGEYQNAGRMLLETVMEPPKPRQSEARQQRVAKLEERKRRADEALTRVSARFAADQRVAAAIPADLARLLPSDSALVEFARYQSFDFSATGPQKRWGDRHYVAFVLHSSKGENVDVDMVPLGLADRIDEAIKKWRITSRPGQQGQLPDQKAMESAARAVADLVWKPLVPFLRECRKVYLSPDGEVSFVPFVALPGREPSRFLIDDYDIAYVGSGRDLLRPVIEGAKGDPIIVSAPNFGRPQQGQGPSLDTPQEEITPRIGISDLRAFRELRFDPLPGTETEAAAIARLTTQRGQKPILLTGDQACEERVKAARGPRFLHLATSAFFLPDTGWEEQLSKEKGQGIRISQMTAKGMGQEFGIVGGEALRQFFRQKGPLHRSGVSLAGANDTICGRWEAGGNDGLLTAEEIAGLDLCGTRMVVISGCESGVGEARMGEGVFGLRRAFTVAGAENLVMALWKAPDEATSELMESLYTNLATQGTPQRALLAAQRAWIAKERAAGRYPHPLCWAAFVANGIGFGLDEPRR